MRNRYSVIIPTLNEESNLPGCIAAVQKALSDVEIIVVDGKSGDQTAQVAKEFGVKVIETDKGRGSQLDSGARTAQGEILVFLHADTLLPANAFKLLDEQFESGSTQVSTFRLKFDHRHWILKFYSFMSRFESIWTTFGDQCIIVRKPFYTDIGGFREWPLFEDVDFLRRARKLKNIGKLKDKVTTSAEKFIKNGILRQQFKNGVMIGLYLLGKDPRQLYRNYYMVAS
jgi:rSAM/selenodomain-associated transferase 2